MSEGNSSAERNAGQALVLSGGGARAAYHQYVPAFHRLYRESNQDMRIFLDKVQAISKLNKLERDTLLEKYSRQDELLVKKLLTN